MTGVDAPVGLADEAATGPGFALLQEDVLLSWQRPPQPPAADPFKPGGQDEQEGLG
jgi:hypothetical protein